MFGKKKEEKVEEKKEVRSANYAGIIASVMVSVLLTLTGSLMTFVPGMKLLYFCYVGGGSCLVLGLGLLVRYFYKEEYRLVSNYDFSIGVIVFISGVFAIIRAKTVTERFSVCLGALILLVGVLMLQHAVQMIELKGKLWPFLLILSGLMVLLGVLILLNFREFISKRPDIFYILLIVAGVSGILSQIIVGIRSKRFRKEERKQEELFGLADDYEEEPIGEEVSEESVSEDTSAEAAAYPVDEDE